MWVCKTCGQINEDTETACMLCGSTDREKYETAPAPKVVIPPPEERVAKRPDPKIDTSLKRPTFGTGSTTKTTGTGGSTRTGSGIDTTIRRPSSTGSTSSTRPTSTATRPTSTSSSATRTSSTSTGGGYTGTSSTYTPATTPVAVKPYRWWLSPLIFLVASLVGFYPVASLALDKGVSAIAPIAVALPVIAILCFVQRACFHRGAGVLGFLYQIALTVGGFLYIDHLFTDVYDSDIGLYLLMAAAIFVGVLVLKIRSIVRFFRAGRKGFAIPLIFLATGDLYFFFAAFMNSILTPI